MAQFPFSDLLTGAKRIYTSIMAQKDDATYEVMGIDNNGGIKTALVTELPPGTQNIGSVTVNSLPEVAIKNNALGNPIIVTTNNPTAPVALQDNASAIGVGNPFAVGAYKAITVEISGNSTSRTIVFQGMGPSSTPINIMGTKLNDNSSAFQTTGTGELWRFNVTGLTLFQANVTAIAGGTVSVSGTATL